MSCFTLHCFLLLCRVIYFLFYFAFCISLTILPVISDPTRDPLYKIWPVIDLIKCTCRDVYYPCTELCTDESLVLFKGRLSFRQFITTKRVRFGYIYQLCSSSGVLLDFFVYHGNSTAELMDLPRLQTTEKIPVTLLQLYLNNGHVLFTDNFYTTPRLQWKFLVTVTFALDFEHFTMNSSALGATPINSCWVS